MDPLTGTWVANLAKSQRHQNHQFQSATLRFEVFEDTISLTQAGVNMSGKNVSSTLTLQADGMEHPVSPQAAPGVVVVAKWIGTHLLETVGKKDGEIVGRGTYEVSPDRRTLTARVSGTDAAGAPFEQVIVFDRDVFAAFNYSVCAAADLDEMARLLGEEFSRRDPPAVATGLTAGEFEVFVRLFCPRVEGDSLTIVARSAGTGEMVGALLVEDSVSTPPDGMDQLSAKFDPIFDILGALDTEYRGGQAPRPGESLHLLLLGVAQRFAGQGVARQLVATCLENGARRGYRVAVTEATNKTSQHIFRTQGFVERVRGSYRDHRFDGQSVFASIVDHEGPILMDKLLTT